MAVHTFQVSLLQAGGLERDKIVNVFHMDHVGGILTATNYDSIADDVIAMFQARYANTSAEIRCKVYEMKPKPNFPVANRVVNTGVAWTFTGPRELALCLSYAANRGIPSQRGRMYLNPQLKAATAGFGTRPTDTQLNSTLDFYRISNASFPDLGGVDWKFGIWSPTRSAFYQAKEAWVDDEWDIMRSRGTEATKRFTSVRDG